MIALVTVAELYAGETLRTRGEAILDAVMKPFEVIDIATESSMHAGRLVRQWQRSHGLGFLDAFYRFHRLDGRSCRSHVEHEALLLRSWLGRD